MNDTPRTILIVDDDPQVLRLVEKMLKARQVKILLAPRPSEALAICASQPVDLLISGHYHEVPPDSERVRHLKKPFFPSDLVAHLHALLP
jgi:DNA-binding NtrC family response regulator